MASPPSDSRVLHRIARQLLRGTGRDYAIAPELQPADLLGEIFTRGTQGVRGLLRFRQLVFIGRQVKMRSRRRITLGRGASIGESSTIDARGARGINLGPGSRLGRFGIITTTSHLSLFGQGVTIGRNSGVGDFFHLGASGGITIGDDVIIGPYFLVHSQGHNYEDATIPIRKQGTSQAEVVIADDCWIGSRVTLLAGTELGPRTVVASGAVVRGKHLGNEILAGVPARQIKQI